MYTERGGHGQEWKRRPQMTPCFPRPPGCSLWLGPGPERLPAWEAGSVLCSDGACP